MRFNVPLIAIFTFCLSSIAFGQQAKLEGNVYEIANGKENPVSVSVRIIVPGGQAKETDSRGHFSIAFPITVQSGQATRIEINREGWVIYEPMLGNCVTQSATRNVEPLKVIIIEKHSILALAPKRLSEVISQWSSERIRLSSQVKEQQREIDEYAFLKEYAEKYGFTLEQFKTAANEWAKIKESDNKEEYALKEYWLKNYDRAAQLANESAFGTDEELESTNKGRLEASRKILRRFQLAGNAFYEGYKFREALAAYNEIDKRFSARKISKDDLPEDWVETQELLSKAKTELGTRVEGEESKLLLAEAVQVCHEALKVRTPEQFPLQWATVQTTLGVALWAQGERVEGSEGTRLLAEAVQAFHEALKVRTREQFPLDWAATQNNLGNALRAQGELAESNEGTRLLTEAVQAFREALKVRTREQFPMQWAATQNNLGIALRAQGELADGVEGVRLLGEAVQAYQEALKIYTREQFSLDWAMTQNNLGNASRLLGERAIGAEGARLVGEAVRAFRQALQVYTRKQFPQDWAMTQINLGNALGIQGERTDGAEGVRLLGEAVQAYREALKINTREQLPLDWAMTQNNLCNGLRAQGERVKGAEGIQLLGEAVQVCKEALKVRTREQLPRHWAMTQNNLAEVYSLLGNWQDAAASYANVLKLYPNEEDIYGHLRTIYRNKLFSFDDALVIDKQWLEGHQDNSSAQANLAETHFTTGHFDECARSINALLGKPDALASTKTILRTIEIADLLALNQADKIPAKIESLIAEVSRQPAEFKVEWVFDGTKHFIAQNEKLSTYREWLGSLFDALAGKDRETILNSLRKVEGSFR